MITQAQQIMPIFTAPSLGAELVTALDVVNASTPEEIASARESTAEFASHYGFSMPGPGLEPGEASVFLEKMRPAFDQRVARIAEGVHSCDAYVGQQLINADIPAVSAAGLVSPQIAFRLFESVRKDATRLHEFFSEQTPRSPYLKPLFVASRVAADLIVFGGAFAFLRNPVLAAGVAGAFAVKLELSSAGVSRILVHRANKRNSARLAHVERVLARVGEQAETLARIQTSGALLMQGAAHGPKAGYAPVIELEPVLEELQRCGSHCRRDVNL